MWPGRACLVRVVVVRVPSLPKLKPWYLVTTDLGLEPPTRLERLTRLVGTAVIVVAVLWVGMVTALAVLSGATSVVGLLIYVGGVLIGLAGVGLGVLIRRT